MSETILIAGASVRGAVDSAVRGDWRPVAADLFNDQDLHQQCQAYRIADYPEQLLPISQQLPAMPWMYTGGLENHPQLVDQVSQRHQLLGNPGSVLRQACDPFLIQQILTRHDLHFPPIRRDWPEQTTGRWLRKSVHSTGGKGIQWARQPTDEPLRNAPQETLEEIYYQQFVPGLCCSGVFLAEQATGRLMGATRQIIGKRFTRGKPFSYAGSIGPLTLTVEQQATLARIGSVLTGTLGLRGLFGVDFVCQQDKIWVLEINPRFPASAEILDRALGASLVDLHCQACQDNPVPELPPPHDRLLYGKAILYARRPCTITAQCSQAWLAQTSQIVSPATNHWFWVADVPAAGTVVPTGSPIISIMTRGKRIRQVQRQLIQAARQVRRECNAW